MHCACRWAMAALLAGAAQAAAPPGDWPMFIGRGNRTAPTQGLALVDSLDAMRLAWHLERHMGVGKGLYRTAAGSKVSGLKGAVPAG